MTGPRKTEYRITIEKREWLPVQSKEWVVVADHGNERDGGAIYDYAYSPGEEIETTKILEQNIEEDDFDVRTVIKAVNGL